MIKNKCKRIISIAMLLVMMATVFSVDVFAGGECSAVTVNCEGVFKGCCTANDMLNNTFNKETGHLTISETCTEVSPIASYLNCKSLRSVTIPNSVTKICDEAFKDCTGLTSVTIPNRVTYIGNNAFDGCTGLTSVIIGNGVKTIGKHAFDGCIGLDSITIPEGITMIDECAFKGCTSLTEVTIPNGTCVAANAFSDNTKVIRR